jgi:hypothetical protein
MSSKPGLAAEMQKGPQVFQPCWAVKGNTDKVTRLPGIGCDIPPPSFGLAFTLVTYGPEMASFEVCPQEAPVPKPLY